MKVTARATFIHGQYRLRRGETADLPAATAKDLLNAGLVREPEDGATPKVAATQEAKPQQKQAAKSTKATDAKE